MLYNTLLKKVRDFTESTPNDAGSQTLVALARADGKDVEGFLASIDIREVGNLRRIIPQAFPKTLRAVPLVAEQNIHDAWRVQPLIRNGKSTVTRRSDRLRHVL